MAEYLITHETTYRYSETVTHCHNMAMMHPQSSVFQKVHACDIKLDPLPVEFDTARDYFGNQVYHFSIETPHREFTMTAMSRITAFNRAFSPSSRVPRGEDLPGDVREYRVASVHVPLLNSLYEYGRSVLPDQPVAGDVLALAHKIREEFRFDPKATLISTPVTEVLRLKAGVCQDFAHFMLAVLRSHGIAARYVSGYIETHPPAGRPKLRGSDASHAWVAFYSEMGWLEVDPTNGKTADEEFIVTATGRDYFDVAPLKGILYGGGAHEMTVSVDVHRTDAKDNGNS